MLTKARAVELRQLLNEPGTKYWQELGIAEKLFQNIPLDTLEMIENKATQAALTIGLTNKPELYQMLDAAIEILP